MEKPNTAWMEKARRAILSDAPSSPETPAVTSSGDSLSLALPKRDEALLCASVPAPSGSRMAIAIPLEAVLDSPYQPRLRGLTKADVRELMQSMAAVGQTTPIIVAPAPEHGPDKYVVHAGHRRCAALRFLGGTTVLAIVRDDLDERAARRLVLADNLGREDLTAYEQAHALDDYCKTYTIAVEEAAAELGFSRRTAFRLRLIVQVSDELKNVFRERGIAATSAECLARIDAKDPKKSWRLANQFADGKMTLADLEAELRKLSSASVRTAVARKDVTFEVDDRVLDLRVRVVRAVQSDEQRTRVVSAVAQLLRHLGVARVEAATAP